MPGGKPFFFYKKGYDWWVIWSHLRECWVIKERICPLLDGAGFRNQFKTAVAAMKAAEKLKATK